MLPLTLSAHLFSPSVPVPWNIILNEASGSVRVKGEIWTHTDGGDPARLHRIEPANGSVMHTVDVANAVNVDREDITTDGSWLYIGAVGNNSGDLTNLRVLRVALDPVLDPLVNTVSAATIGFSYGLQTSFTPALNNNDRDREALVAFNDSLWLFSKNWVSGNCYISKLPAEPGNQATARLVWLR